MKLNKFISFFVIILMLGGAFVSVVPRQALACCTCEIPIRKNHQRLRLHITTQFMENRKLLVYDFWHLYLLPAMQLMTNELSTTMMQQVEIIGAFIDAKNQLETQRLFQQLVAEAHKDYHPSESICEIGTGVRSLAASERATDLAQAAFAERLMQRQLISGEVLSEAGMDSDKSSRFQHFVTSYCEPTDNGNGLAELCGAGASDPARRNLDVDFVRTLESRLTLDIDFAAGHNHGEEQKEDVFALAANLYGHTTFPMIEKDLLAPDGGGSFSEAGAHRYIDVRSIAAKRSVAQNSFAAIAGMRVMGDRESAPYIRAMLAELGLHEDEITEIFGQNPSYFAQMEVLTKKIYQNPNFYAELYDKPVNVERKGAILQAIGLMQDRDIYESLLRSEASLAVYLETLLTVEQEKVGGEIKRLNKKGGRS